MESTPQLTPQFELQEVSNLSIAFDLIPNFSKFKVITDLFYN